LEEEALDKSEPAPVEGSVAWFCCLATVATALKYEGEEVNIPGTEQYGSTRTTVSEGTSGRDKMSFEKYKD